MKNIIEKVSITYHSRDIKPSVVLALFFRMLGVYVHERLVNFLPDDVRPRDDFCINIYLITESFPLDSDFFDFESIVSEGHNLFLVDEGIYFDYEKLEGVVVNCNLDHDMDGLLKGMSKSLFNILNDSYEMYSQDIKNIEKEWEQLIDIYLNYKLYELTFTGKFFYADHDLILQAKEIYIQIIDTLRENSSKWAQDEDKYYRQFAIMNMAYEINALCVRDGSPFPYSSAEILHLCDLMIEHFGPVTSLLMLKGQVLEDLQSNPSDAYDLYKACYLRDEFNVYAIYKVGMYKEKHLRLWDMAVDDYKRAFAIYPVYYRVLYRWAVCEENQNDFNAAIKIYKLIITVLADKYENRGGTQDFDILVRPMEIEYLFKSAVRIAGLYEYSLKDPYSAVKYYKKASSIYNMIDESKFFNTIFSDSESAGSKEIIERLNSIIKKKLNIDRVREKLERYEKLI